jgi:hypothetical protein
MQIYKKKMTFYELKIFVHDQRAPYKPSKENPTTTLDFGYRKTAACGIPICMPTT